MPTDTPSEMTVLTHLAEIHKLLDGNAELANAVKERLELMPIGGKLNKMLLLKRNQQTYYNERFGLELLPILDGMIASRESVQFLQSDTPDLTIRTIYLKIWQSWRWLMDWHRDKALYIQLYGETIIVQKPHHSVQIKFGSKLKAKAVDPEKTSIAMLQDKITKFLRATEFNGMPITDDIMFDEKKLSLDDEQIANIKDSLVGIPNLAVMIDETRVRILRKFVKEQ